jgi:hypothetical protein
MDFCNMQNMGNVKKLEGLIWRLRNNIMFQMRENSETVIQHSYYV